MHPRLLEYYNQELAHLREMGAEFAEEFPKVASRLGVEGLEVADPYVERLLEGFAFIAGRIQLKLDAEFPRFAQHLLEIVLPHYLAPVPSMLLARFEPRAGDPALIGGPTIPRGSALRTSIPVGEQTPCQFTTAHPVRLWPIRIERAEYFTQAVDLPLGQLGLARVTASGLRLRLTSTGDVALSALRCDELPIYIDGPNDIAGPLHELVHSACFKVLVVDPDASESKVVASLDAEAIGEMGYHDDEALLPHGGRTFSGYRLLQEYFAMPERFRFFCVKDLAPAFGRLCGKRCDLVLLFHRSDNRLEPRVDQANFALYATPAVNVFHKLADRIHLTQASHEHHLVVDRARPLDFEVFSVRRLRGLGENMQAEIEFRPFYGRLARDGSADTHRAFYSLRREPRLPSARQRRQGARNSYVGTEVFISLADERAAPYPTMMRQLAVEVLATNRDLPLLLSPGSLTKLMLEGGQPVERVEVLTGPTRPRGCLPEGEFAWRLISHLTLQYQGLFSDAASHGGGASSLREMLLLYVDPTQPAQRRQIEALVSLTARPEVQRLPMPGPIVYGRGMDLELRFNESGFDGAGAFLLASVLEKFLARHATANTFTRARLVSEGRGEIARWPARAGTQVVI